ncbi:hypothetical protein ACFFRR_001321 [Megaselia abdita]
MSTLNVNNENNADSTSEEWMKPIEEVVHEGGPIRQRPIRASRLLSKDKPDSSLKIKKRTIMRPNKKKVNLENVADLYLKQKIGRNFKPSSLETIQEGDDEDAGKGKEIDFNSARKIKRSLSCSDGLNYTKKTITKRRNKIKKTFGRRYALRVTRISLDVFLDRLNASFDETTTKCEE